jgi:hypothetical protein
MMVYKCHMECLRPGQVRAMAVDATTIVLGLLATPTLIWLITYFGKWSIIGGKYAVDW